MAVLAALVTVAATATKLSAEDGDGQSVLIKVPTGGSSVFLGGSGVTTGAGYELVAGESVAFDLGTGDVLYGIVAADTQAVNVLRTGV